MKSFDLFSLSDPVVRDLAWVLTSPPLVHAGAAYLNQAWFGQLGAEQWAALEAWDEEPQALHQFVTEQNSRRLGRYFETLCLWWLQHSPRFDLLAHNLQVAGAKQTLGEFDLLARERSSGAVWHIETSVKFFLGYRGARQWSDWIGTDPWDTLDKKLTKMNTRQMKLGTTPEGKAVLAQLGIDQVEPKAWVKGMFFGHPALAKTSPEHSNRQHLRGWWVQPGNGHALPGEGPYRRLPPLLRLAPRTCTEESELVSAKDLIEPLRDRRDHPPEMVAEMVYWKGEWREKSRGVLVSPAWPEERFRGSSGPST